MLMLQKFISLLFLFFFIIINNTAYANKFKIKDLEIDLFDKNKQIKSSRNILEGYASIGAPIYKGNVSLAKEVIISFFGLSLR